MSRRAERVQLVAREAELAALQEAVERAAAGQTATVLVGGDAGVGKSRLLAELSERAQREGVLVLVGRCIDVGAGELPYAEVVPGERGRLHAALARRLEYRGTHRPRRGAGRVSAPRQCARGLEGSAPARPR